jgi:hypothetical protein
VEGFDPLFGYLPYEEAISLEAIQKDMDVTVIETDFEEPEEGVVY